MSRLPAFLFDELAAEVLFRRQRVMSCAAQGQIRCEIRSALGERFQRVQLQVARLAAARAVRVGIAAAPAITLEDLASFGCGDLPAAPARAQSALTCLRGRFPCCDIVRLSHFLACLRCTDPFSRPSRDGELALVLSTLQMTSKSSERDRCISAPRGARTRHSFSPEQSSVEMASGKRM